MDMNGQRNVAASPVFPFSCVIFFRFCRVIRLPLPVLHVSRFDKPSLYSSNIAVS
jgi:hypothetical protein